MKIPKELVNGFIIVVGIGIYFLIMELLGLADIYLLRLFNVLFIFYGTHKTLEENFAQGKRILVSNSVSALFTALTGVFLSIIALIIYSYSRGGNAYIASLSRTFLFGGDPSIMSYSISLLFEGIVSAVIVTFMLMLYWDTRYTTDKHNTKS
ncbi:hypothetical protein IWX83_000544 [Flavobacterium sp. CG_9.1]|uniref:DUF4199 domain-containing protein n=2 Tax=Flavobacterium TaxID=237 RepID=A0A1M7AGH8_9FLAO|nr:MULTISPECIES: hypothetical protein [Flavobacterium]MBG6060772.1 hypothetical protein [Flavobacterium sp. CG_9.1]OAB28603.1 hypothetical protein FBFR_07905 [Flavobacterium fryxellicola]SHL41862.1 hypothetical protein SAMN05443669_100736 [Flavobacterium xanthum]SHN51479.1 hypothetical protein SAMN05444395_101275 [Flavobacterium fryxellicola]